MKRQLTAHWSGKQSYLRVQSFLIRGTGAEDFWQGCKNFFASPCGGTKILTAIFMGYKTILLEKFWMKSSIKD